MKVKWRKSALSVVGKDVKFVEYINKLRKLGRIKLIQQKYPYFSNDTEIEGIMGIRKENLRLLKTGGSSRTLEKILKSNVKFSELSGNELRNLIEYIIDSTLMPQEILDLPENASVAFELEFEGVGREDMERWIVDNFPSWQVCKEPTVYCGGEITSPPIILNREKMRIVIADYLSQIIKCESGYDISDDHIAIRQLLNIAQTVINNLENENLSEINILDTITTESGPISIKTTLTRAKVQSLLCKWDEIKSICDKLKKMGVKVNSKNASVHIHFGAHYLGDNIENWRKFIKLYILYEDVLFRFFYGDKINARTLLYMYSPPARDRLHNVLPQINSAKTVSELKDILMEKGYSALNFDHVNYEEVDRYNFGNTIEVRIGNFTCEEEIIKNYILCVLNMIRAAVDGTINEDKLDKKIEGMYECNFDGYYIYNEVNLSKTLEFLDLVYKDTDVISKINFLIQYIKKFEHVYNNVRQPVIAKSFVKKGFC